MNPEVSETMIYIKGLEDRVGKHSRDMEKGFEKVVERLEKIQSGQEDLRLKMAEERLNTYQQIQEVKDKVAAVEKAATEKTHKLSLQVVAIASAIGMLGGGAGAEIKDRWFDKPKAPERAVVEYKSSTPMPPKKEEVP